MNPKRYERQVLLFGEEAQKRLSSSKAFIAGAGGLGCPVATYLAAAGVGRITICDSDSVDISNLNRQFLHFNEDVGRRKTSSAAEKIRLMNPEIEVLEADCAITEDNVRDIVGDAGIIMDCLDNFETRRVLNREAVRRKIPMIHGAVSGWDGQATTIIPGISPCFECIFPADKTPAGKFPIVGTTAGVVGSIQANEAVRLLTGSDASLSGKLLIWDGRSGSVDLIPLLRNENCHVCSIQK